MSSFKKVAQCRKLQKQTLKTRRTLFLNRKLQKTQQCWGRQDLWEPKKVAQCRKKFRGGPYTLVRFCILR